LEFAGEGELQAQAQALHDELRRRVADRWLVELK
jgi:hypothetical protein